MSISSISFVSTTGISLNVSDTSQLEKQAAAIQQQIQQENSSKDDEKTKKAKIQQLETQLENIKSQIQQKQSRNINNVSGNSGEELKSNDNSKNADSDNIIDEFA
ncbi:FlxA-like family protein [Clostridium tyrobutyricum]|uniref:FlxA-like family protein n=1 Tax=Clostridium tyrobutyricum TaxID=1519 RepID=UPI0011C9E5EE|nr:FlxA-like family protein [Clostridium tyrobutyricum]